ncbi:MAG: Helix-turn-helix domain protein [Candidatus Methanofastidiosum methylothiophilum]|uniref:Helix-turn-helix domain protein n=1 Tax=Candidatus Methanofastidiosum methylothiophilum TaxID=1705564 RepID=A0A150IMZ6_9EURY|nr:MAG: Helix-turn-helix domain protein [Candidatus Methanofastidiosum methylthiophilus]OPY58401.1 MAG: Helix-turn-helix domain protein [Pelotomaculum sp. PtaU1.Bin065]
MKLLGEDEVLNLKEAVIFLKIGRTTLLKLAQEGKLPGQKIGNQWRFSRQALLKWLESGQAQRKV